MEAWPDPGAVPHVGWGESPCGPLVGTKEEALAGAKPGSPIGHVAGNQHGGEPPALLPTPLDLGTQLLRACDSHQGLRDLTHRHYTCMRLLRQPSGDPSPRVTESVMVPGPPVRTPQPDFPP